QRREFGTIFADDGLRLPTNRKSACPTRARPACLAARYPLLFFLSLALSETNVYLRAGGHMQNCNRAPIQGDLARSSRSRCAAPTAQTSPDFCYNLKQSALFQTK